MEVITLCSGIEIGKNARSEAVWLPLHNAFLLPATASRTKRYFLLNWVRFCEVMLIHQQYQLYKLRIIVMQGLPYGTLASKSPLMILEPSANSRLIFF